MRPAWLRTRIPGGNGYARVRRLLRARRLHTVCDEARCPNRADCWGSGTATFLLLGDRCTRSCRFCSVGGADGAPQAPDPSEAGHVVEAAGLLLLRHVVLTSVTRDDLADGGAGHFASVIAAVRRAMPDATVEALIPPLGSDHLATVMGPGVEVLAHNVEVVRRLTPQVRDPRADYEQSLTVLRSARSIDPSVRTKSSILLGLGETTDEVLEAFDDLREAGVRLLAVGQYLRPTRRQIPVARYVPPEEWDDIRAEANRRGFDHVAAGPFVRTSYRAHEAIA